MKGGPAFLDFREGLDRRRSAELAVCPGSPPFSAYRSRRGGSDARVVLELHAWPPRVMGWAGRAGDLDEFFHPQRCTKMAPVSWASWGKRPLTVRVLLIWTSIGSSPPRRCSRSPTGRVSIAEPSVRKRRTLAPTNSNNVSPEEKAIVDAICIAYGFAGAAAPPRFSATAHPF